MTERVVYPTPFVFANSVDADNGKYALIDFTEIATYDRLAVNSLIGMLNNSIVITDHESYKAFGSFVTMSTIAVCSSTGLVSTELSRRSTNTLITTSYDKEDIESLLDKLSKLAVKRSHGNIKVVGNARLIKAISDYIWDISISVIEDSVIAEKYSPLAVDFILPKESWTLISSAHSDKTAGINPLASFPVNTRYIGKNTKPKSFTKEQDK